MRCAVNPKAGFADVRAAWETPAPVSKRVLIIGGGPAGLMAALTAADRGHQVSLYEKDCRLGGALKFADHIPFKEDIRIYRDRLTAQVLNDPRIEVRLNTEMTRALAAQLNPDVILAAIGARTTLPPIPGITAGHVMSSADLPGNETAVGPRVAVIGGGSSGAESAIHLARLGHQVTLIGRNAAIARDCTLPHQSALRLELEQGVDVHTGTHCLEVTGQGVVCQSSDGTVFSVEADTVINATGMTARTDEAYALDPGAAEFQILGDCRHPGKILQAVRDGFFAAIAL